LPSFAVDQNAVSLNIPYDAEFRKLYLAYIVGLYQFGLKPRVTLGIPGGDRRLDRIQALIRRCRYSIHDLSRVQLDRTAPMTPRFNMPFELGLAVASAKFQRNSHAWFVFETRHRRVQKSLSDLDGTDANIHGGTVEGVMRELCNAFVRRRFRPTVSGMMKAYRLISKQADLLTQNSGGDSIFAARAFEDLCFAAKVAADEVSR
jgi:hypothetical protein